MASRRRSTRGRRLRGDPRRRRRCARAAARPATPRSRPPPFADERRHERTLLHVATDWPGHFPRGAATVAALVAAGADVGRVVRRSARRDAAALGGQQRRRRGARRAGRGRRRRRRAGLGDRRRRPAGRRRRVRPVARGATADRARRPRRPLAGGRARSDGAARGAARGRPVARTRSPNAFWCACHGGQREAAERLLDAGADLNWVGLRRPHAARRGRALRSDTSSPPGSASRARVSDRSPPGAGRARRARCR